MEVSLGPAYRPQSRSALAKPADAADCYLVVTRPLDLTAIQHVQVGSETVAIVSSAGVATAFVLTDRLRAEWPAGTPVVCLVATDEPTKQ